MNPSNRSILLSAGVALWAATAPAAAAQSGDVLTPHETAEAAERGLVQGRLDAAETPSDQEPGDEFETGFHDDDDDGLHDAEHRLDWPDAWGTFGPWDYGLLGVAAATVVGTQIIGPLQKTDEPGAAPAGAGWQVTNGLDDVFRTALRRDDYEERGRMRDASDLFLSFTVSFPFLFDGLISALWFHESPEVGRELALLAIEVQFVTAAIQSTANMLSSRVRPYVQDCDDPDGVPGLINNGDCTGSVRYRSFFSGHTSQAFAGAVTSCVFHGRFPLYGGGSRDVLPCVALLASATATGLFRVMGDMHHITDVIAGALVGSAVGLAFPLLRMRSWGRGQSVSIVPTGAGLAVVGTLR